MVLLPLGILIPSKIPNDSALRISLNKISPTKLKREVTEGHSGVDLSLRQNPQ